jgi:hypothetical protein
MRKMGIGFQTAERSHYKSRGWLEESGLLELAILEGLAHVILNHSGTHTDRLAHHNVPEANVVLGRWNTTSNAY